MNETQTRQVGQHLSLKEAADRLHVSTGVLRKAIQTGELAAAFIGAKRIVRIDEAELARYVDATTVRHASVREVRTAVEGRSTP